VIRLSQEEFMLTQKELQELLIYVPEIGTLIWKERPGNGRTDKSWNTKYAGKEAFTAVDRKGYRVGSINYVNYRAARVIYKLYHGIEAEQVDHIDGDRSNNRIVNLRAVTHQQNQQNMKRSSRNTSGVVGVSWNSGKNRWDAKISVDGTSVLIGRYIDFHEAVIARKRREQELGYHPNHGR
jgi:hypothetical protein